VPAKKKVDKTGFQYIMEQYEGGRFEDTDLHERFIQGKMVRCTVTKLNIEKLPQFRGC